MSDLPSSGSGPDPARGLAPGSPILPAASASSAGQADPPPNAIDASRVRSFIGISIGLVGPRANLAVAGVLITLYVQHRASGALAVTFALTADRLVSWLTYPIMGRFSDRTQSRVGRRTPYMAGSLIVLGASTWMFTVVRGYWLLVLFIVIAGQASAIFTLTNVAVVPEVFGRSRWLKSLVLTTVLGSVAALVIKATVITSWKQNDPATWNLPFQVAAVIMVAVGIVVLIMVREAPAAVVGASVDRGRRARRVRDELRDILAGPNAKVLVAGSLLFYSGIGSTLYVAILFFQRDLHAGASAQTIAGLATGIPVFFIGIGLGIPISRIMSRRQLAIGAPLIGAVLAGVQYFDTHIWQAVVLSYIGAPFIGAYIIVLAPMLLQLLPRSGGLGERLGVLLSPFNLCSVAVAYLAATVVDATGNYRLIWLFPAATGLAHATVNYWLKFPPKRKSDPDMIKKLWEWSIVQAEGLSETGIVTGLLAAPLLGVVSGEDADSAVVVDMARKILGNPYEEEGPGSSPDSGSDADPSGSSDRDVTGVIQVGGGPVGAALDSDQKFGPRTGSGTDSSGGGSDTGMSQADTGVSQAVTGVSHGATGTPLGGVIPRDSIDGTPDGSVSLRDSAEDSATDSSSASGTSHRPASSSDSEPSADSSADWSGASGSGADAAADASTTGDADASTTGD